MRRFTAQFACAALLGAGLGGVAQASPGTPQERLAVHQVVKPPVLPAAGHAAPLPTLRKGSTGPWVRTLQSRLVGLTSHVCGSYETTAPCRSKYSVVVDGVFGGETREAVVMFQRQEGLRQDGIVGPKTWAALYSPRPLCDTARRELVAAGATSTEVDRGVRLAKRESGCRVNLHVLKHSTRDDSYGPWMVNYYSDRKARSESQRRASWLGAPWRNTVSWPSATWMFLKLGRTAGWCHWTPIVYCGG